MKIFISYNRKNVRLLNILADDLKTAGHDVWYDGELAGGEEWWKAILQQIRECDFTILALTTNYLKSEPCRREYEYALALNKYVIPVCLADVEISDLPSTVSKFQLVQYQQHSKQQALRLVRAIGKLELPTKLPEPLPEEPLIPLSPVAILKSEIGDDVSGNQQLQSHIVLTLKEYLRDEETSYEAWILLQQLLERDDQFNARIFLQLKELAENEEFVPQKRNNRDVVLEPRTFTGHKSAVTSLDITKDDRYIVTASKDFTVRLWSTEIGMEERQFTPHNGEVTAVTISPDGKYVFSGCRDNIYIWDFETGNLSQKLGEHNGTITSLAISSDGSKLLAASTDKIIRVWDISTQTIILSVDITDNYLTRCVCFSPDGRWFFTANHDNVYKWDAITGEQLVNFVGHTTIINDICISSDGRYILTASGDHTVRLWDANSGDFIKPFIGLNRVAFSAIFSPKNKYVAAGTIGKTIIWDIETMDEVAELTHMPENSNALQFSSDGQFLFIATDEKVIRLKKTGLIE